MADEFIKGLGILTGAGLAWIILAGWYRTSSFESTQQLIEPVQVGSPTVFDTIGVILLDGFVWFAILGALTFWFVIPAGREAKREFDDRRAE